MDDKTIRRNLLTNCILLILCLFIIPATLFLRWTAMTMIMGGFAAIQIFFICLWWNRKRNYKPRFQNKTYKPK